MRRRPPGWLLGIAGLLSLCSLPLAAEPVRTDHAEAELHLRNQHAVPGERAWIALRLRPDPGWHTYWQNPGDSGLPTRIDWTLPEGVRAGAIRWPAPDIYRLADIVNYGYGRQVLLPVPLEIPADWPKGRPLNVRAQAEWLICADICVPERAELSLRAPVAADPPAPDPSWKQDFDTAFAQLPRPLEADAAAATGAGALRLRLRLPEDLPADAADALRVYPVQPELVNHSAPQELLRDAGALWLEQPLNPYFDALPAQSQWVLAAHRPDGTVQAWRFSATRQPVAAPPAGAQPVALSYPESDPSPGASLGAGGTTERSGFGLAATPSAAATSANAGDGASPASAASTATLPLVLLAAFVGGLILNLMPCVFPVLAIKALSVLEAQGETRAHQRLHGLVYTGGVVAACLAAAGLLLALRAGGSALGWGFQLQSPVFIAVLACLFFAFGLSLSGVFSLGTSIMGIGQKLTERQGLAGSFNTGVLAVVVASPCTAPFMGSALGFAVTQPAVVALLIFAMLGLGLAAPFLLIGFLPQLARRLPKPGPWMEQFKQLMAFPLYLSVAWLLWVLSRQAGSEALLAVLVAMVLIALAAWLWHRPRRLPQLTRIAVLLAAVVLIASPMVRNGQPRAAAGPTEVATQAQTWSPERVAELRARGETVFVNFTADWCITCLANERVALGAETVQALLRRPDIHYLKADWTRPDERITRALADFGRNGVPLYLVYRNGGEAEVLPQILTADRLRRALLGEG